MQSIEIEAQDVSRHIFCFVFWYFCRFSIIYFFKALDIWSLCRHTVTLTVIEHESFVVEFVEVFKLHRTTSGDLDSAMTRMGSRSFQ